MNSPQCAVKLFLKASDLGWSFQLQRSCHYLNHPNKKIWGSDNSWRLGQNGRDPENKQSSCIFTAHCHPQTTPSYTIWPSYSAMEMTILKNICFGHRLEILSPPSLRDGWQYQNGCIFGKFPNGLWLPPSPRSPNIFQKIIMQIWFKFMPKKSCLKVQDLQHIFLLKIYCFFFFKKSSVLVSHPSII